MIDPLMISWTSPNNLSTCTVKPGLSGHPKKYPKNSFFYDNRLRGYIFQKLLLAWKFSCINKNCFFVKETDTFGQIVVWTTYTSHKDHFTPQHTAFEQSAACLSVFLELLPGLIPLTMLWHAGWTLEKTICMNMTYNYSTTIFRSIFVQNVQISGRKIYIFNFCLWTFQGQIEKL